MSIRELVARLVEERRSGSPPAEDGDETEVRLAVYDSSLAAPQVVSLRGDDFHALVGELAARTYQVSRERGGRVPFVVIREIMENLIHAYFRNATITVLDEGNTIRVADQGPGIGDKERALLPGFSTATSEMRRFIRGVGSGLPVAKEQMQFLGGALTIEDNLERGTVVTLSVRREAPPTTAPPPPPRAPEGLHLSPKYTFETFVVGAGNRFAHAAALAVAEAPARAYNPLFIYGGVGLGKTHLLQAIGHHVMGGPGIARVAYVSSEKFTNELINSIRDDKTLEFRQRYRSVDVLLIDDIQFLAGKERTQEEFFHTFNTLHEANHQIIISSDRPPKEIPTLEDRLRSRFEWGLIADIQPPDLETRIAILRKKAESEGIPIPDGVAEFIAQRIPTNIRELEGALVRVVAYASLTKSPASVDLAAEVLRDLLPPARARVVTIPAIHAAVAEFFGIRVEEMRAKRRTKGVAFPRQVAMYLAREMTDASLPRIGEEFGGRDHTTVMHACQRVREALRRDAHLAASLKRLMDDLQRQGG